MPVYRVVCCRRVDDAGGLEADAHAVQDRRRPARGAGEVCGLGVRRRRALHEQPRAARTRNRHAPASAQRISQRRCSCQSSFREHMNTRPVSAAPKIAQEFLHAGELGAAFERSTHADVQLAVREVRRAPRAPPAQARMSALRASKPRAMPPGLPASLARHLVHAEALRRLPWGRTRRSCRASAGCQIELVDEALEVLSWRGNSSGEPA